MGLRANAMGGGQFKQAINQIIEAERIPVKGLETKRGVEETRLKNFQEFKGKFTNLDKALAEFANYKTFRELKADLGDGANLMSVTLDKSTAEIGSYSVQIDQLAARTSVITNGFESDSEPVLGIGFVVAIRPDGNYSEIYVDEKNSSLRGVAKLINMQDDFPARATVIKDITDPNLPWKLIISAKKDGADDGLVFPELYFLDGAEDVYIDGEFEAQNAQVALDGFPIEAESNQLKDFLEGVNFTLKQARPDQPFTLAITEDYVKMSGKVKALVDSLNNILEFVNKQNQVDEKSDTKTMFTGDSGLQSLEFRIRNMIHEGFPIGDPDSDEFHFMFLNQLGVEFDKKGVIQFKEDRFNKILENNFDEVSEALIGPWGFSKQLGKVMSTYSRPMDGILTLRETGIRNSIKRINTQIEDKERRIEQKQTALVQKFARLEANLSDLQKQQQYLSATLPGAGGGGNLLGQLMGG